MHLLSSAVVVPYVAQISFESAAFFHAGLIGSLTHADWPGDFVCEPDVDGADSFGGGCGRAPTFYVAACCPV